MNTPLAWFCKIFIAPFVKKLFIKEINGLENFPKRNFILISNHQSYLDIILNGYLCVPRRFNFIGQFEGFKIPLKWVIILLYFIAGVIPLDRQNKESRKEAIKKAIDILKKGNILILYPEGKRSTNGLLQEGKPGMARIFLKTGVPILPVALSGPFELFPPKGKLKIKRIVKINVGQLLFFEKEFERAQGLDEDSLEYHNLVQEITDKTMSEIKKLC